MGKYNFDTAPDRRGTYSLKWDCADGVISMGIADMDFETAPQIKAAVIKRAEHGVFGYSVTPDEYFIAIRDFFERRHGYRFDTADMIYSSGVVAAISSAVSFPMCVVITSHSSFFARSTARLDFSISSGFFSALPNP